MQSSNDQVHWYQKIGEVGTQIELMEKLKETACSYMLIQGVILLNQDSFI